MRLRILRICFIVVYALLNWNKVSLAQCSYGGPPLTISNSFSSTLGSLTDSIYYPYKFNPALGTLIGVELTVSTAGQAILEVINDVGAPILYEITYRRKDYIRGPGLGAGVLLDTSITYPPVVIGASDNPAVATSDPPWKSNGMNADMLNWWGEIQSAPGYEDDDGFIVPKTFNQTVDPSEFGAFMGPGPVVFNYDVLASLLAEGFGGRYSQRIVTLNTQVTISTIYTYCPMGVLPEGKLTFSARKTDNNNVALSWIKEREETGITYIPEVSTDGKNFSGIHTMTSQQPQSSSTVVKYELDYSVPAQVSGRLYFRLKQTDATGRISYTPTEVVTMEKPQEWTLSLYPNPAEKQVYLQFGTEQKHNLQAELINSVGQVVEKTNIGANNAGRYTFNFLKKHPAGIYFVRVTNTGNRTQYTSRLMIR